MALIECPECGKRISSYAEECPNCGLPKKYFNNNLNQTNATTIENFSNILDSFKLDYDTFFSNQGYISNSIKKKTFDRYYLYFNQYVGDKEQFQRMIDNYVDLRIDYKALIYFAEKMKKLDIEIENHNNKYVTEEVANNKEYFDNILMSVDPNIKLDQEQRKAVVTDDDYCLLIAGAGAGKTTTMAAKVKWLVDKKNVKPEEIMLISYTNKAIEELKDRINKKLNIPAKIATFHSFAFDVVKRSQSERPEVNFTSYKIIEEMIQKKLFYN